MPIRRIIACAASFGRGTLDSSSVRLPASRSRGEAIDRMRESVHPIMDDAPQVEDEAVVAFGERGEAWQVFHQPYSARRGASLPTASCTLAKPPACRAAASSRFSRGIRAGPA